MKLPAFKHGDRVLNESYAAILYLEVRAAVQKLPLAAAVPVGHQLIRLPPQQQDQFKSQGNKLVPDSPAEKAVMYQRMMEGNTFQQTLGECKWPQS